MSFGFGIYTKPARNLDPTLFETGVFFADQFLIFMHPFKFLFFLFILCVISSHCVIVEHQVRMASRDILGYLAVMDVMELREIWAPPAKKDRRGKVAIVQHLRCLHI